MTAKLKPAELRKLVARHRIDDGKEFRLADHDPGDTGSFGPDGKAAAKELLNESIRWLGEAQAKLYAQDRWALLLVFQAMDAAGKDGAIAHVMSGVNPQGCQVYAFKAPSSEELDHDFLWRCQRALPERGRIGVWNRSHYEEVLVVQVRPEFLDGQRLPRMPKKLDDLWDERYESIVAAEKHWARNGCVILKFFLHVSQEEQHARFLDRVRDPDHHWKFNSGDLADSKHWDEYMAAYERTLRATSKPWAPWYAIPADSKSFMRLEVARIVADTFDRLALKFPTLSENEKAALSEVKKVLESEAPE